MVFADRDDVELQDRGVVRLRADDGGQVVVAGQAEVGAPPVASLGPCASTTRAGGQDDAAGDRDVRRAAGEGARRGGVAGEASRC